MSITELVPTVKGLSHTDKLLLLQILVQELVEAEGMDTSSSDSNQQANRKEAIRKEIEISETFSMSGADQKPLTLEERRTFLQQPLEVRRRILSQQAQAMTNHYTQNTEWQELTTGDIVEY